LYTLAELVSTLPEAEKKHIGLQTHFWILLTGDSLAQHAPLILQNTTLFGKSLSKIKKYPFVSCK
jgi:hypothetical protein